MSMDWSSGLLACTMDTSLCLDSIFCFPCLMGRQCSAIEGLKNTGGCCYCLLSFIWPAAFAMTVCLRCKIVDKWNIDEGRVGSTIKGLFCCPCSFCQTHRELTKQDFWPGGTCCHSRPTEMR